MNLDCDFAIFIHFSTIAQTLQSMGVRSLSQVYTGFVVFGIHVTIVGWLGMWVFHGVFALRTDKANTHANKLLAKSACKGQGS